MDHNFINKTNRLINGYSYRHWKRKVKKEIDISKRRVRNRLYCSKNSTDAAKFHDIQFQNVDDDLQFHAKNNVVADINEALTNYIDPATIQVDKTFQCSLMTSDERSIYFDSEYINRYSDDESDCDNSEDFNGNNFDIICTDKRNDNTTNNQTATCISNSLKSVITTWAIECNINHVSISKLLHAIREDVPTLSLPLDPRTLLKTPRSTKVDCIGGGQYIHFGIKLCLEKIIYKRVSNGIADKNIGLIINIDGAPLGESSEKNLWPILCSDRIIKDVFIIGVYAGESKPTDANEFLNAFVEDSIEFDGCLRCSCKGVCFE